MPPQQQQQQQQQQPPMGPLPAPPTDWRNAEESMRSWLQARQEEDRRRQEEEKTRQETLRLEQRKIEQNMLHESLQGGIPPYLIPMVFAGMGGANLANASLEGAQHYLAHAAQQQLHAPQHPALPQPPHSSPESRRESRVISSAQPSPYAAPQQGMQPYGAAPSPATAASSQQGTPFMPSYTSMQSMSSPASGRGGQPGPPPPPPPHGPSSAAGVVVGSGQSLAPTSVPRPPPHAVLPRLTTDEIHIQPSPHGPAGMHRPTGMQQMQTHAQIAVAPGPPPPPAQAPPQQEASQSSPALSFLHWQPPVTQAGSKESKEPGTPSGQ